MVPDLYGLPRKGIAMKRYRFLRNILPVVLLIIPVCVLSQSKLPLNETMLYNFSTRGSAGMLVDEQALAGDPAAGQGGDPLTVFSPGWVYAEIYYPAMVVLDLGRSHILNALWFYDVNDCDTLSIYTGDPSSWELKSRVILDMYNAWRNIPLQDTSRFIMLKYRSPSVRIAEIVLYGQPVGNYPPAPVPVVHPRPAVNHFMGVNGFVDDPIDKLACAGSIREYHNWGWDEGNLDTTYQGYPDNQYAWNPSWVSGPGWAFNFDGFYQQLKDHGLTASPDLQGSALYMTNFIDSLTQNKPIRNNGKPLDPASYIEHSDYMFQFAARYASHPVNDTLLKLRADQPRISGSDRIAYLENWNEPDKTWFGRPGYFTPDEFATFCSADYDGHEQSLGMGKGMKNAAPQIKMVMAGLTGLNLEYLRCMKLWSDFNRTSGFPAEVLNFHHYSANNIHGISPEADSLKQKLKKIVAWRDSCMPGKEIWLSEFGYDTNPESEQAAVAIDTNDIFEVQGAWILRSYLEAVAAGIDKAFVFMLRDANAPNPNKYNSSGLTGEIWYGHQPKKSWYYVSAMKNQLTGLIFDQEIPSNQDSLNIYRFLSAGGDTAVHVVWCTSATNRIVNDFSMKVPPHSLVWQIRPRMGSATGLKTPLPIQNDTVNFRVTELPVFIRMVAHDSLMPIQINLNNVVIPEGESRCFDAVQVITTSGIDPGFMVETGAAVDLIAGQRISLYPLTRVAAGGAFHARITETGVFCETGMVPDENRKYECPPGIPPISAW
ncbi:MAG TPA: hypothetical protein PK892_02400 [Bacteroidales bacterium]|nr:hypothetical protein [Bacteroidales bacterium]